MKIKTMTLFFNSPANWISNNFPTVAKTTLTLAGTLTLAACSSSSTPIVEEETPSTNVDTISYAFAAVRSSDYQSGRIDRISLTDGNTIDGSYPATLSDIAVTTDDTNVYQIGRYGIDSLTRYDAVDTSIVDYQVSVNDDSPGSANPQSLAFLNDTKAYLTRRGSTELWVVDPDNNTDGAFKIGGIDLSAYDTDLPNMTDALIVGDYLFVIVERLNELPSGFQIPDKSAYLVVIDTTTDMEIQTNQGDGDLLGIELSVRNPTALQYNADTNEIYVVGRGNYYEDANITDDFHSGGIETIDPITFETQLLIDDGTDQVNQGYFVDAEVINASLGYLLTYQSFGVTTLRTFNPTLGVISNEPVGGLQEVDITVLAQGPDNHLWVGVSGEGNGFLRIDLATGAVAEGRVDTELVPIGLTFINVPAQ